MTGDVPASQARPRRKMMRRLSCVDRWAAVPGGLEVWSGCVEVEAVQARCRR